MDLLFSLSKHFPAAGNDPQSDAQRFVGLGCSQWVSVSVIRATLRVSVDDTGGFRGSYHGCRGLAREGAGLMITAVLCAGGQSFCNQQPADSTEMNEWRT